jgi:hypothetical protein
VCDVRTSVIVIRCAHATQIGARYDSKVDMYSLGIILFEMRRRFDTGMERATAIMALRQVCAFVWVVSHLMCCVRGVCDTRDHTCVTDTQKSQLPAEFEKEGANAKFGRVILQVECGCV